MFRNKICGCQYKQEVVRQVVDGNGGPGVAKMRCPTANCENQRPLSRDDLERTFGGGGGSPPPSASSSMRRPSSSSRERKERPLDLSDPTFRDMIDD